MMSCSRAARDRRGPPSSPIGSRQSLVSAAALPIGPRLRPATAPWKIINNRVKCGAGRGVWWGRGGGVGVAGVRGLGRGARRRVYRHRHPSLSRRDGLGRARPGPHSGGSGGGPGELCGPRAGPAAGLAVGVSTGRQALAGVRLAGRQPLMHGGDGRLRYGPCKPCPLPIPRSCPLVQQGKAVSRLRVRLMAALGVKAFRKECWD
ncbi:uncharacterized protein [Melopsittacus undulatus]|uniref:uncharacterized protein n=1 Tax=Melopsittacus undulatus TaxID=13146 RepID=UPI00146C4028|nr:uncharacterized protein LOC117435928 [Melopsittacus undulatus]